MKHLQHLLLLHLAFLVACQPADQKENTAVPKADTSQIYQPVDTLYEIMDKMASQLKDKVQLDTLMTAITHQENVKLITPLKEDWNDTTKNYIYSGNNYYFELTMDDQATTFKDGPTKIKFNDYSLTCMPDSVFKCENFGFKNKNSLTDPKIIEVCGRRFLYSNVSYWCNGIGCGCFITFIYDLQNKKPTFLENYRIPFDGFYLSDFNNDNNPDLLVISQTDKKDMKDSRFEEFNIRLSWYNYDNGNFKPKFDKSSQRSCCYELYSFTPYYHHSYHQALTYSLTKNNWLK